MKRLTILGIIACIGLLFAPAAVLGAGPPGGLDVKIVDPLPLPVTGDVNATVTGDVNVVNEPGVTVENTTPIPVKDSNRPKLITTDTRIGIYGTDTQGENDAGMPPCPDGERFLISGLSAAPSTGDFPDSLSLSAWVVSVQDVYQLTGSGFYRVPLIVGSEGHRHASMTIPGGQAGPHPDFADTITVRVQLAAPYVPPILEFEVHITGFCGTPYIR